MQAWLVIALLATCLAGHDWPLHFFCCLAARCRLSMHAVTLPGFACLTAAPTVVSKQAASWLASAAHRPHLVVGCGVKSCMQAMQSHARDAKRCILPRLALLLPLADR